METATLNPATTPVILARTDFEILNSYVKNLHGMQVNERENFSKLSGELKKAQIVEDDSMPADIVRLGSTVVIKDLITRRDMTVTIVLPSKADIKQKKVSVLAPVGTALIGFRKGQTVSWNVPSGKKDFKIVDVNNENLSE
ncbi:MAG TPA: GreA/GreB family elongation factor [Hanamia sp.]|jgi:regulator of nucleoside diphosphate kinase|nr:GreA/GreB family elongation factor [Hanamia sp.]